MVDPRVIQGRSIVKQEYQLGLHRRLRPEGVPPLSSLLSCVHVYTRTQSAVSHTIHFCCVTQQTHLLCHTADMLAESHSRHVCCHPQQTCLLCDTADMTAVSHSRHDCCVTQQTCWPCPTADMSAVSHSRSVRCVTQQTCDTADISAM